MATNTTEDKDPLEMPLTVIMALISVVAALTVWRASLVGSQAGGLSRDGIIETIKAGNAKLTDVSHLYQEAWWSIDYYLLQTRVEKLNEAAELLPEEGHEALATAVQAEATYLSPMSDFSPLAGDPGYLRADGSLDLERRLAEIRAENAGRRDYKPEVSFREADQAYARVRLFFLAVIPLGVALVACTVAQAIRRPVRYAILGLGVLIFALTLAFLGLIEAGIVV